MASLAVPSGQCATLAGKPVQGGATVEIQFPVAKYFQDVAAQNGNPRVEIGRAVLIFPPGFDPATAANTGIELIDSLVKWDLAGQVRYENQPTGGAQVTLAIPSQKRPPSSSEDPADTGSA